MSHTRSSAPSRLDRLRHRLTAIVVIGLIAVSGGLLAELNQQAQAEARVGSFESGRALG